MLYGHFKDFEKTIMAKSGHLKTVTTNQLVKKVRKIITVNLNVMCRMPSKEFVIAKDKIYATSSKKLGGVCAQFVPYNLTDGQENACTDYWRYLIKTAKRTSKFLDSVVTGNKHGVSSTTPKPSTGVHHRSCQICQKKNMHFQTSQVMTLVICYDSKSIIYRQ